MAETPRPELPTRPGHEGRSRPFPREAYVFGWLVICLVAAEGIHAIVTGVLGTGIIFVSLVPVMIWLMHIRPRRHSSGK
ncbi:MAG TPA: hypothetical protein VFJ17_01675 [Mycobacteriales bacterium]|nr:hypothetical protein [Mycobacteriales bacterium]